MAQDFDVTSVTLGAMSNLAGRQCIESIHTTGDISTVLPMRNNFSPRSTCAGSRTLHETQTRRVTTPITMPAEETKSGYN